MIEKWGQIYFLQITNQQRQAVKPNGAVGWDEPAKPNIYTYRLEKRGQVYFPQQNRIIELNQFRNLQVMAIDGNA